MSLYTVNNAINPEKRAQGICVAKPIHIEDNVRLSGDVQITAGMTIWEGSVIAAGVVTKDVPTRVIAAGNPFRVLRPIADSYQPVALNR